MGKIFDALEKSKEKHNTSVAADEIQEKVLNSEYDHDKEASYNKPVSLYEEVKPENLSNQTLKKVSRIKQGDKDVSLVNTKELYDINNIDKNMVTLFRPQSFEAEQFKILRTNLLFPTSGKMPRSILITSTVPDEGKSFVAANLAISIAQNIQEHVLLMDCDMRRPSVHKSFGFGNTPGLSEHLSNATPLSSLILETKVKKLSILPGGTPPHNPSELLSSERMSKLLEEVKYRYRDRYVIIDAPPPKLTAEAGAISRQVDGILLVVKYGSTPREMVSDLIKTLGKEKLLGIILNKLDMRFSNYYGLGKYKTYSKYYQKY